MIETPTREEDHIEEVRITGDSLWSRVKKLFRAGNRRRVVVVDEAGKKVLTFSLTVGVIAAIVAPELVLISVLVALALHYTIIVERKTH